MPRVAVIADSSACLPPALIERHGIGIVALGLTIDGVLHPDGSLTNAELFRLIEASQSAAQTTTATPGGFLEALEAARDCGAEAALVLTLSAQYSSGTFAVAQEAARLAREKLPGFEVRVVDTGGLAMTHGFAVLAAARVGEETGCLDRAAEAATSAGPGGRLLGSLETLRFLVKGGRVPWVVGWAASVLRIKPVLSFEDGSARSIGRPRTWAAARDEMLRRMEREVSRGEPLRVAVMHVEAPDRAHELANAVRDRFSPIELIEAEFTSVMAVHTGPGFAGIAWLKDEA
jgi:DegV family protein with EDD domain